MSQAGITTNSGININVGVTIDSGSKKKALVNLEAFRKEAEQNGKIELKINYDKAKGAKTQIETLKIATGEYVRVLSQLNSKGEPINQTILSVGRSADTTARKMQELNNTTKHSINLFQDFTNTFMKMAKFNTINLIYDGLISKMSEAIEITNDFDKAMTEFKKVTDTSNLSLSEYTEKLGELGEETGRTATQMLEAATEFSKSGYDADTSAQLAQVATLFQNIADSEISAGDASSFIISQMKAFGIEANNATSILDKINEVKLFVTSQNRVNCGKLPMIFVSYNGI